MAQTKTQKMFCETCRYWGGARVMANGAGPKFGACRCHPPKVGEPVTTAAGIPLEIASWPWTLDNQWCGHWDDI